MRRDAVRARRTRTRMRRVQYWYTRSLSSSLHRMPVAVVMAGARSCTCQQVSDRTSAMGHQSGTATSHTARLAHSVKKKKSNDHSGATLLVLECADDSQGTRRAAQQQAEVPRTARGERAGVRRCRRRHALRQRTAQRLTTCGVQGGLARAWEPHRRQRRRAARPPRRQTAPPRGPTHG